MPQVAAAEKQRASLLPSVLSPVERASEAVFGLIIALSFTCSVSVITAKHEDVRTMLIEAICCNFVWGVIDGVMYVLARVAMRGRSLGMLRVVRGDADAERAHGAIKESLPPLVASILRNEELEHIRNELKRLPEPPKKVSVTKEDCLGALGIFLIAFLSTFPVVIPFLFIRDHSQAMRWSNYVAIAMLFVAGYMVGKYSGGNPVRIGLGMVAIGTTLVVITVALGG